MRILALLLFTFQFAVGHCQIKTVTTDTIVFYEGIRVDQESRMITSSFNLFVINSEIYSGDNFPFDSFLCENDVQINQDSVRGKDIKKLLRKLKRKKFISLESDTLSQGFNFFKKCLSNRYQEENLKFYIKSQRFIASYTLEGCNIARGVDGPGYFCYDLFKTNEIPVIRQIRKFLK